IPASDSSVRTISWRPVLVQLGENDAERCRQQVLWDRCRRQAEGDDGAGIRPSPRRWDIAPQYNCRDVGYNITDAANGRVVITAEPNETHLNPAGTVHGGFSATLLDSCMGL